MIKLVDDGKLSNKLARQVIEGVLAGEGEPEQVMNDRGLVVVRDDSLIQAAIDEALAAQPDIAEKIRGGKVQARRRDRRRGDEGDQAARPTPPRVREVVLAACCWGCAPRSSSAPVTGLVLLLWVCGLLVACVSGGRFASILLDDGTDLSAVRRCRGLRWMPVHGAVGRDRWLVQPALGDEPVVHTAGQGEFVDIRLAVLREVSDGVVDLAAHRRGPGSRAVQPRCR